MPQEKEPIARRPKVEDESTGQGADRHGKHREADEGLPGSGGSKGGLNRESGVDQDSHEGRPRPTRGGQG